MTAWLAAHWREVLVALAGVSAVAMVGGLMTEIGPWYEHLRFPKLRPPNWLFGPAWTTIFALIAAAGVVAWNAAPDERAQQTLLALFVVNGLLNVAWSPLFFKLRRPDWALFELIPFWVSIAALVVFTARFSPTASLLLVPYLAWVTFAGWLNMRVVQLNAPFAPERS